MALEELLRSDATETLNFFYAGLQEQCPGRGPGDDETVYVASVLASYALSSRSEASSLPPLASLSELFDHFVFTSEELADPDLLEIAGAQDLLLAGFFRDQMRGRHSVAWYDDLGSSFYRKASLLTRSMKRGKLFSAMARNFPFWTRTCRDLSRELRESRFLLRLN